MLRVVIAVVLATALLAVSLPVVDAGRRERANEHVAGELARLEAAMRALRAESDPVTPGREGGRRVVDLRLPSSSWSMAGVDAVVIAPATGSSSASEVVWRLESGGRHVRRLDGLRVEGRDGPLVLRERGRHRLALGLVRRHDGTVIRVTRIRFKYENATTAAYGNPAGSDTQPRVRVGDGRVPL